MLKDYNNAIIDSRSETELIYNSDNKKWETKKNDVSLDICKKKCNDDKDCYGIGDFFSFQKACVTYKKDALKSENIISDQKLIDYWCNLINSIFSIYYKDVDTPNKILSKNIGFDVTGSRPSQSGSSWSNNISQKTKNLFNKKNCEVGYSCSTPNGFGTYNSNCDCIVNSIEKVYQENQEECNLQCDLNKNKDLNKNSQNNQNNLNQKNAIKCYPNNSNFSKICSDQNPMYGVKQINLCNDKNTSSVICDSNYLNGKYIGNPIITPCLNKTDDFDVWCKYYNTKPVPDGYNINSIGVKNLLVGKEGECYLNNNPDNSKARAICDYNYIQNVTKINSSNLKNNNFTDCSPINSNFNILCSNISKTSIASEIMGYDCNPGFARAKCIDGDSIFIDNNSSNNLSNDILATNVFDENKIASRNFCRTNCKKN
jgi:hypothetical protein